MISQLTVFLANEKGRLAAACRTLADADINMKALFIADPADFGIVRIFCDTPKRAVEVLGQAGFRASLTPVIAVSVEDAPGTLADLLGFCQGASMNIEYGYCFCTADGTGFCRSSFCPCIGLHNFDDILFGLGKLLLPCGRRDFRFRRYP